jgi:WD40 repeat protein
LQLLSIKCITIILDMWQHWLPTQSIYSVAVAMEVFECIHTLQAHTGTVSALAVDHSHIYSGGQDGVVAVWDLETRFVTHRSRAHQSDVLSLIVGAHHVFIGGACGTMRVWRKSSMRPCHIDRSTALASVIGSGSLGDGDLVASTASHAHDAPIMSMALGTQFVVVVVVVVVVDLRVLIMVA